ncbi:hypothetical protein [Rhizobium laguerreae]|uniref:hypothetical protein n=1 Tax=Rhizobium laguerreae TaxID=1076926 RepID=UPI00103B302D|nr:hypothetical protein [Rhizobium laguerreae]TBY13040.1 hypothetical protein E0I94_07915 [Rhizobium laguerreae]
MRVGDWLVDFDVSGQQASFTGYWHVAHRDNENDLTFVRKRTSVAIPTIGKLKISNLDRARLEKMIGTIPGKLLGPAEKITPIAQVVSSLDNWAPMPSIKAFDRAMFAIHDQAASFGYYPRLPFDGRKARWCSCRQAIDQYGESLPGLHPVVGLT